ncbi:MAG: FliH/SctL family protein, partial [Burkholderiales bacterium]
ELVLPLVREVLNALPQTIKHPTLILHPEDAALVRSNMGAEVMSTAGGHGQAPWRIVEDAKMRRGGCRVETTDSEIDASIQNRWKHIANAFNLSSEWLEQ